VGEGDAALAEVFDDHARIASLDLHAVVNVPIVREGRCVATFNVLGRQPRWQVQDIAAIRLLALLAAPHVITLGRR
jgi:GAF domain-containing protein